MRLAQSLLILSYFIVITYAFFCYPHSFYGIVESNNEYFSNSKFSSMNSSKRSKKLFSDNKYPPNISLTKEQEDLLRKLGEPLLDLQKVQRTLAEWSQPLPSLYLTSPLVISGPSAVGKNRLIRELLKDYSRFFSKVVTHTTRSPRPDEINGINYHFITIDEFQNKINNDSFIEWSKVHDNYYGVSIDGWRNAQIQGKISILEIDIQGAKKVKNESKRFGLTPKFLFIAPPHVDKLRDRLIKRGTESNEQIELRLKNAYIELEQCQNENIFDEIIINDDLENARNAMFRHVRGWYPALPSASRLRMMQRRLKNIRLILTGQKKPEDLRIINEQNQTSSLRINPSCYGVSEAAKEYHRIVLLVEYLFDLVALDILIQ